MNPIDYFTEILNSQRFDNKISNKTNNSERKCSWDFLNLFNFQNICRQNHKISQIQSTETGNFLWEWKIFLEKKRKHFHRINHSRKNVENFHCIGGSGVIASSLHLILIRNFHPQTITTAISSKRSGIQQTQTIKWWILKWIQWWELQQ